MCNKRIPGCTPQSGTLPWPKDGNTICMKSPNYNPGRMSFYNDDDQSTWIINVNTNTIQNEMLFKKCSLNFKLFE